MGPLFRCPRPHERKPHDQPCHMQSPEQQQHRLGKRLEIVVPINLVVVSHGNFPKHLGGEVNRETRNMC